MADCTCNRFGTPSRLQIVILCLLLRLPAKADNWLPARPLTRASYNGNYIIHVEPSNNNEGTPCVGTLLIREGTVLWRRPLTNRICPADIMVSSEGHYVVTFDDWSYVGYGQNAIAIYGPDAQLLYRFSLEQLLSPEELSQLTITAGSRWWRRGCLIDEQLGLLYLVISKSNKLLCIELATGEVRPGSKQDVNAAIHNASGKGLCLLLELAKDYSIPNLGSFYRTKLTDPQSPPGVRLRAAAALYSQGCRDGESLVEEISRGGFPNASDQDRAVALQLLPDFFGLRALQTLSEAMRATSERPWVTMAAQEAFVHLGEASIPQLNKILNNIDEPNNSRVAAVEVLRRIGSKNAIQALLDRAEDADPSVAEAAVGAACALGDRDIAPSLCSILERGKSRDEFLVSFFTRFRYLAAADALITCLERHLSEAEGNFPIDQIVGALEYQTNVHLGREPKAWRAWVKRGHS